MILDTTIAKSRQQLSRIVKKVRNERYELERLEISNMSYKDVEIITPVDETIIYIDPPYESTTKYQEGDFCHRELEEYTEKSPYKIYVSSYKFNLPCVASFKHQSSLSATSVNTVTENLYCNQEHRDLTRLF